MRLVFISDTHDQLDKVTVPDGDVLIHCGDLLNRGDMMELAVAGEALLRLPHKHKIFVPGNHDWAFQKKERDAREKLPGVHVLIHESVTIAGLKFFGSPWQPEFCNWAFNVDRYSDRLRQLWEDIPEDTDVLVTHSPPAGVLDMTPRGEAVGCYDMAARVAEILPRVHAFGHIHHSYGTYDSGITRFVNASICDEHYRPTNKPVVRWCFDLFQG